MAKAHNVRPYIIYLIIIFIRQNNAITDTDHQINAETPMFLVLQPAIAPKAMTKIADMISAVLLPMKCIAPKALQPKTQMQEEYPLYAVFFLFLP